MVPKFRMLAVVAHFPMTPRGTVPKPREVTLCLRDQAFAMKLSPTADRSVNFLPEASVLRHVNRARVCIPKILLPLTTHNLGMCIHASDLPTTTETLQLDVSVKSNITLLYLHQEISQRT
jgi:hypothetical protein